MTPVFCQHRTVRVLMLVCIPILVIQGCAATHTASEPDRLPPVPDVADVPVVRLEGDGRGLRRDTYYFLGLQFLVVGALYMMPESVTNWDEESKSEAQFDEWLKHVKKAKWDKDDIFINYVTHPYWGAAYCVRGRERGYGRRGAFWYSVLLSTLYEYGLEAVFEHPSQQDLIFTPLLGSWLGGYFMNWRASTRERIAITGETRFRDRAVLGMTDPLGSVSGWIDRRLGLDSFTVAPFVQHHQFAGQERVEKVYGLHLRVEF